MKQLFSLLFTALFVIHPLSAVELSTTGEQGELIYLGTKTTKELNVEYPSSSKSYEDKTWRLDNAIDITARNPLAALRNHSNSLSRPAQKIGVNITGASASDQLEAFNIPQNPFLAVGEEQFVLVSFNAVRSFNKKTGRPDGILDLNGGAFFGAGQALPKIKYDRFAKRWYAVALPDLSNNVNSIVNQQTMVLMVSNEGVITEGTKWAYYVIPNAVVQNSPAVLNGQYSIGIDKDALYINVFPNAGTTAFLTSGIVIQKTALLSGNLSFNPFASLGFTVFRAITPEVLTTTTTTNISGNLGVAPADNFDEDSQFGYYLHARRLTGFTPASNNTFQFYRVVNPGSTPPTPILVGPITLSIPTYALPPGAPHKGNLLGSVTFITGLTEESIRDPHVRNKQLYACHTTLLNSAGIADVAGDRNGIRWYQFDLTGDPTGQGLGIEDANTVPVLVQAGTLYDPSVVNPIFYYMSGMMTNKKGDLVVESTSSGVDDFTNVIFAGRRKNDPQGVLRQPVNITNNPGNAYNFTNLNGIWGRSSNMSSDPVHDRNVWSMGEWASVPNAWGFQITELKPIK